MSAYSDSFYEKLDSTALPSAQRIVPMVAQWVAPRSAVDIGCGNGAWLSVLQSHGCSEVLGLDGPWVDRRHLRIPPEVFRIAALDQTLDIDRRFDLALSLEVAEHLPAERAAGFVVELTELAPVVLFSAAIPGQGGVHHVNEQWPDYWAAMFRDHGFALIDVIRWRVWSDPEVAWWYAQNILLFANEQAFVDNPRLARLRDVSPAKPPALVHPQLYEAVIKRTHPGLGRWLKTAPQTARRSLRRIFGRGG